MGDLTFDEIIEQIAKKKDHAEYLINMMKADIDDYHANHEVMAKILSDVAIALKGPEAELSTHSWHDLKEVAERVCADLEERRDNFHHDALMWRGLDIDENAICKRCSGAGVRAYGDTSTWRKRPGMQMFTSDVCDCCWGSGNSEQPWTNLRHVVSNKDIASRDARVKAEAVREMAKAMGLIAASWDELDSVCETMEMAGLHEETSYKMLKAMLAEAEENKDE